MTEGGFGDLVRVARIWNNPPELRVAKADFTGQGFSKAERVCQLTCANAGAARVAALITFRKGATNDAALQTRHDHQGE
jgi:hypothetical protein